MVILVYTCSICVGSQYAIVASSLSQLLIQRSVCVPVLSIKLYVQSHQFQAVNFQLNMCVCVCVCVCRSPSSSDQQGAIWP